MSTYTNKRSVITMAIVFLAVFLFQLYAGPQVNRQPDIIYGEVNADGKQTAQVSQEFIDRIRNGEIKEGDPVLISINGDVTEMAYESGNFTAFAEKTVGVWMPSEADIASINAARRSMGDFLLVQDPETGEWVESTWMK